MGEVDGDEDAETTLLGRAIPSPIVVVVDDEYGVVGIEMGVGSAEEGRATKLKT